MRAMGGSPAEQSRATRKGLPAETTKKSDPEAGGVIERGSISDISPLPPDESRLPIELRDLGSATVVSKSKYENTSKLKNGSFYVAHVVESLRIKVIAADTIEVEREQKRFDKNDNPIGSPMRGTMTFELGKSRPIRGNQLVWKFEGSTLFYQVILVEGGFRTVIPLYKQNDTIKCVVMSGFSRENGTGPVKTIGADGSVIEILKSKKISSTCDVVKA
jgi:hypothetical protein